MFSFTFFYFCLREREKVELGNFGASAITWGRSKLIPLICGCLEVIMLKVAPIPPPTSTRVFMPSNPLYIAQKHFMNMTEWLFIPSLKSQFSCGLFALYSNAVMLYSCLVEWNATFQNCILQIVPAKIS
jgi:hypothetical protein